MASPVLQFKRGAFVNLPGLKAGEPGFTTDKYDLFVGLTSETSTNQFFGSGRYWGREDGTTSLRLKLVDKDGTNSINLKAPNTLAGITTYTLPAVPDSGKFLTVDASGNLSWQSVTSSASFSNSTLTGVTTVSGTFDNNANSDFSGITTFSNTTDNTLGNSNTGAVQIDGGLGVDKNVTIGGNLNVQGASEFVGVVTFRGGTINIGDSNTDNINVSGEFISNLTPNTTNTYDVGISTQQWRNAFFAGIGSFANLRVVNNLYDSSNSTGTSGQFLTVTGTGIGWTTISGVSGGSIELATRATTVDTTTATSNTYYPGLFTSATGVNGAQVFVDSGISYVSSTDTLSLTGDIAINGGDATTTATTFNLINGTATSVNFAGAATALNMGAATGIATINNQTLTLPNATTVNVNGANPTLASSSTGTLTLFNSNITKVNAFQAATDLVLSATTGITTVRNKLTVGGNLEVDGNQIQGSDGNTNITLTSNTLTTFAGDIRVNGNDIQASDGNVNITMTSNTLTEVKGDLKVTGNDIQSSTATALTLSGADVTVAGDITVGGNDIKASNGTTALTLSTTGAVTAANNLTVTGNLTVNGSTTTVDTETLLVKDSLIEVGLIDNGSGQLIPPTTDANVDVGMVFHYYSGSAKKAAVYWDDSTSRITFASEISETSNVLTASAYATILAGGLEINNACTGGTDTVISCINNELALSNIVVDGGSF